MICCGVCLMERTSCVCDKSHQQPAVSSKGEWEPPRFDIKSLLNRTHEYNLLWAELHTKTDPTLEWFEDWISRLPSVGCDCQTWLKKYLKSNPPRFDDWFDWTWQLHNAVNAKPKLQKPIVSLDDARACWLGVAPHRHSRLVITIAVGRQFVELLKLTRPFLERYAERYGADFIALTNQQHDQWQREKFRVFDFAKQYPQTLFVDSDLIIRESCPDLFRMYPKDDVVMHDDYQFHVPPLDPAWAEPDHRFTMATQGIDIPWSGKMWNSGVVLTSQRAASIWTPPPLRLPDTGISEQWWVQYQAERDFKVTALPSKLNWQYWFPSFADGTDSAEIVHASGTRNKSEVLKQFL